jgi:C-methyltransferase C-terminal domain
VRDHRCEAGSTPEPVGFAGKEATVKDCGVAVAMLERSAGKRVLGYGAASRAVALLCQAHVDRLLLSAVIDASPAKQGLRMPGSGIPVADPTQLVVRRPDTVLLFVPDLLAEVRDAFPEVEATGGPWVLDVEALGS